MSLPYCLPQGLWIIVKMDCFSEIFGVRCVVCGTYVSGLTNHPFVSDSHSLGNLLLLNIRCVADKPINGTFQNKIPQLLTEGLVLQIATRTAVRVRDRIQEIVQESVQERARVTRASSSLSLSSLELSDTKVYEP